MDERVATSEAALKAAVTQMAASGLTLRLRDLAQDVWGAAIAGYEPDDLGHTPTSLAWTAVESFKTRALRRILGDDREVPEDHWNVDGLTHTTPHGVLVIEQPGVRMVTMKTPVSQGRRPDLDRIATWETSSQVRQEVATRNSQRLGGYQTSDEGDDPLFSFPGEILGPPDDFMVLWAGETTSALTSGWLGVPILGGRPFIAVAQLWRDEVPGVRSTVVTRRTDRGPSFTERTAPVPKIGLRPQADQTGQS